MPSTGQYRGSCKLNTDLNNYTRYDSTRRLAITIELVVAMLAAAFFIHPYDVPISDYLRQYNFYKTPFGSIIKPLGKYDFVFFAVFFVTWATGNRRLLYRFAWAAIPSGIFVLLVKVTVARPRPTGDNLSFPSGDSSIAFVWATILAAEYPLLAVPAYLTASFIAIMRVSGAKHYPADILAGSAVGFAAASLAIIYVRKDIPRRFFRAMRRLGWGVILPITFILYTGSMITSQAVKGKHVYPLITISAAVIVLSLLPVIIARARAYRRLIRLCRNDISLTKQSHVIRQ